MIMKRRDSGDKSRSKGKLFVVRSPRRGRGRRHRAALLGAGSEARRAVGEFHKKMETVNHCFWAKKPFYQKKKKRQKNCPVKKNKPFRNKNTVLSPQN